MSISSGYVVENSINKIEVNGIKFTLDNNVIKQGHKVIAMTWTNNYKYDILFYNNDMFVIVVDGKEICRRIKLGFRWHDIDND